MASTIAQEIVRAKQRMGMTETAFLSVGGEGGTTGMHVLCNALGREGKFFAVVLYSRGTTRGGPTAHILRVGKEGAGLPRCRVTQPDVVILSNEMKLNVTDPGTEDFLLNFPTGLLIVNTTKPPSQWDYPYNFDGQAIGVDVSEISGSLTVLRPAPTGLPLMGVYAGATGVVKLDSLKAAVEDYFSHHGLHAHAAAKLVPANLRGIEAAYNLGKSAKRVALKGTNTRVRSYQYEDLDSVEGFLPAPPLPTYQSGENPNIWRQDVPVWSDAKCIRCDYCYTWLFCPDSNWRIIKPGRGGKAYDVKVDYSYCKGCSICADVCPAGAVEMRPEKMVPEAQRA